MVSAVIAYILYFTSGITGSHLFYASRPIEGFLHMATLGWFFCGAMMDVFRIPHYVQQVWPTARPPPGKDKGATSPATRVVFLPFRRVFWACVIQAWLQAVLSTCLMPELLPFPLTDTQLELWGILCRIFSLSLTAYLQFSSAPYTLTSTGLYLILSIGLTVCIAEQCELESVYYWVIIAWALRPGAHRKFACSVFFIQLFEMRSFNVWIAFALVAFHSAESKGIEGSRVRSLSASKRLLYFFLSASLCSVIGTGAFLNIKVSVDPTWSEIPYSAAIAPELPGCLLASAHSYRDATLCVELCAKNSQCLAAVHDRAIEKCFLMRCDRPRVPHPTARSFLKEIHSPRRLADSLSDMSNSPVWAHIRHKVVQFFQECYAVYEKEGGQKAWRHLVAKIDMTGQTSARETLGVASDATMQQINKAYRALAKEYHPDHNKNPDAVEKFRKIQSAYNTLKTMHRDPAEEEER